MSGPVVSRAGKSGLPAHPSGVANQVTCVTGDLVDPLPPARTTSEHRGALKVAGIIRGTIDGNPCCCLDPAVLGPPVAFWVDSSDCCPPGVTEPGLAAME